MSRSVRTDSRTVHGFSRCAPQFSAAMRITRRLEPAGVCFEAALGFGEQLLGAHSLAPRTPSRRSLARLPFPFSQPTAPRVWRRRHVGLERGRCARRAVVSMERASRLSRAAQSQAPRTTRRSPPLLLGALLAPLPSPALLFAAQASRFLAPNSRAQFSTLARRPNSRPSGATASRTRTCSPPRRAPASRTWRACAATRRATTAVRTHPHSRRPHLFSPLYKD